MGSNRSGLTHLTSHNCAFRHLPIRCRLPKLSELRKISEHVGQSVLIDPTRSYTGSTPSIVPKLKYQRLLPDLNCIVEVVTAERAEWYTSLRFPVALPLMFYEDLCRHTILIYIYISMSIAMLYAACDPSI